MSGGRRAAGIGSQAARSLTWVDGARVVDLVVAMVVEQSVAADKVPLFLHYCC